MSRQESRRSRVWFLPDSPKWSSFSEEEMVCKEQMWLCHETGQERQGLQWVTNSLPTQTGRQGFDFSAPPVVKLVAVPMYSPQGLNRATGHHLRSDCEQNHPLPWVYAHTADLIRSQLWEEKGNATGAGCAQGRNALWLASYTLRISMGVRKHMLLNPESGNCVHGSERSRETSLVHNKLCPELPAWLPIAHFSPYNYRLLTPPAEYPLWLSMDGKDPHPLTQVTCGHHSIAHPQNSVFALHISAWPLIWVLLLFQRGVQWHLHRH